MYKLKSFSELETKENTLYILDIDDTILYFPLLSIDEMKLIFVNEYKISNNYDIADSKANEYWYQHIKNNNTKSIEGTIINDFLNSIPKTSKVIFLTARLESEIELTINQLNIIGISGYEVYFDENKSEFIKKYNNLNYQNIIFVDDLLDNYIGCESITNLKFYLYEN